MVDVLNEIKMRILKKSIINPKNEKLQYAFVIKTYILIMFLIFISGTYNRFIDFLLFGILVLIIYELLNFERDINWIRYFLLLIIAFIIIFYEVMDIFSPHVSFFQTDADSARSLISTIIQSEVAIITIVFTLSLIAIQQTTSAYSPRVIDIFNNYKKNKPFFILFLIYIFCIWLSALLLKIIESDTLQSNNPVSPFLECCTWIVYTLFIFLILALVPYTKLTLDMFKPTTLIKLLSENVSKQSIKSAIELENSMNINANIQSIKSVLGLKNSINIDQSGQIKPIDDTIQPIVDVLQGSMKSYDYETTRYGLKIIEAKAIYILSDDRYNTSNEAIAGRIIDNIKTIGTFATKQKMEKAVNDTATTIFIIFECLVDKEIYEPIDNLVSALFTIGEQTIYEDIDTSTIYVFKKLTEIGIKSIDSNLKLVPENVIQSIVRMTLDKISMENKQEIYQTLCSNVCLEAIESLESICKKSIEKELEHETLVLINLFKVIGISLIGNTEIKGNTDFLLDNLLLTLESITRNLIKSDLKKFVSQTTSIIYQIGKEVFVKNNSLTEESYNLLSNLLSEIIHNLPEINDEHNSILINRIMNQLEELEKLHQKIHFNFDEYVLY